MIVNFKIFCLPSGRPGEQRRPRQRGRTSEDGKEESIPFGPAGRSGENLKLLFLQFLSYFVEFTNHFTS